MEAGRGPRESDLLRARVGDRRWRKVRRGAEQGDVRPCSGPLRQFRTSRVSRAGQRSIRAGDPEELDTRQDDAVLAASVERIAGSAGHPLLPVEHPPHISCGSVFAAAAGTSVRLRSRRRRLDAGIPNRHRPLDQRTPSDLEIFSARRSARRVGCRCTGCGCPTARSASPT